MAITSAFRNAVSAGDVKGIRIMMKDSLFVDTSFREFTDMENLAQSVPGLYDNYDGQELIEDSSKWDDDYMSDMRVQVVYNFSRERLEHLKKVVRHLRPAPARPQYATPPGGTAAGNARQNRPAGSRGGDYYEQKRRDEQNGRVASARGAKIGVGAVAGGVIGGAVAGLASASVLVGAAAGAVVVGAVVAVVTNGETKA